MTVTVKRRELGAFMKLNEAYSTRFIELIVAKEASPRSFMEFMAPSI
jgi:hypothetical protein